MNAAADPRDPAPHAALERLWRGRRGLPGFFTEVRHTVIGRRYLVTAFTFFALGGLLAAGMRLQLAAPDQEILGPDLYDQFFSVHGTTMMFLFAVPVMQGLGVYLVPLMIGTRNVAFPRLLAYSYWVYLIGGLLLWVAFACNTGVDVGWFAYVPLSGPEYSPGKRVDVWAQTVTFTELSAIAVAVNLIVTVFKQRAPGMALSRMPLFVWAQLVTSFMVVFAMPAVMTASTALALDRLVATHFFNPAEGGDALLFQHMFWFFGHPEVYIIFIPALGAISSIVVSSARRGIVGYLPMVLSLVVTGFMGFGLWVHHMFTTGLPQIGEGFFSAASMMIAVPTGIQTFCWIATLAGGRVRLRASLLWVLGFFTIFIVGGLTGIMLASVPIDTQVHDTHFVVAHLHYVLIGGAVFPLLGAVTHWFPKMTGRLLSERLGRWSFALLFAGFNLVFFPLHVLGLQGMTRRAYTYPAEAGWGDLNLLATAGVPLMAVAVLLFVWNIARSLRRGPPAGADPWGADSLEWSTASPPPSYGFAALPTVSTRYPRWQEPDAPVVVGLKDEKPEVLVTRVLDAEPDWRKTLPGPAWAPLFLAVATGVAFIGLMFTPWGFVVGLGLGLPALLAWGWPRKPHHQVVEDSP